MTIQYIDFKEFIEKEIFNKYSINRTEFCQKLRCSRSTLNNIVSGRTKISLTLAKKIEKLFPNDNLLKAENLIKFNKGNVTEVPYFIPNFLKITSTKIKNWIEENPEDSQKQLPVLIRRLILSTCQPSQITECNFPGNDDYRKPGPDGQLKSLINTQYIPKGVSHWEFGKNFKAATKIRKDVRNADKKHKKGESNNITYVAVTPQKLQSNKKNELELEIKSSNKWKDVRIYDATDLEQWIELSLPGQIYFSEIANMNRKDIESIDSYWINFSKLNYKILSEDTDNNERIDFRINEDFFDYYIQKNKNQIIDFYKTEDDESDYLYIVSESIEEGISFVYSLLNKKQEEIKNIKSACVENCLYVSSETLLNDIVGIGVKAELTIVIKDSILKKVRNPDALKRYFKTIVICSQNSSLLQKSFPYNLERTNNLITLYPLPLRNFLDCLYKLNIPSEIANKMAKETGASVNTLSVLYSNNSNFFLSNAADKINKFSTKKKKCLLALATVQSISQENSKEQNLIKELSESYNSEEILETLIHKKNSVLWKEGTQICVLSKYTIFGLLHDLLTEKFFSNYFKILHNIFFDKNIYRHYSYHQIDFLNTETYLGYNILLSLMDTLCLLSSKINEIDISIQNKTYFTRVKNLFISELLSRENADKFCSNSQYKTDSKNKYGSYISNVQTNNSQREEFKEKIIFLFPYLSLIAEIAPDIYLEFIKNDLRLPDSVIKEFLSKKVKNIYELKPNERFEYRCDILRSLESLAWDYNYFHDVIDILAELSLIKIDDNLQNKPFNSLKSILRVHCPQTYVGDKDRLNALNRILNNNHDLGFSLIKSILDEVVFPTCCYLFAPALKWNNPDLELIDEYNKANPMCYKKGLLSLLSHIILSKEKLSDRNKSELTDLISYIPIMDTEELNLLLEKIKEASDNSDDNYRIKIKEGINIQINADYVDKNTKKVLKNFLKNNADSFDTSAPLVKYAYLFKSSYVSPYCSEIGYKLSDDINDKEYDEQIYSIRLKALKEIYKKQGVEIIKELIKQSPASFYIGIIINEKGSFIKKDLNSLLSDIFELIINETNNTALYYLTDFIRGYFCKKDEKEIIRQITRYCKKYNVLPIKIIVKLPLFLKLFKNQKFFKDKAEESYYWQNLVDADNRTLEGDDLIYSIKKLLSNNRIDFLYNVYSIKLLDIENTLLVNILNKAFELLNLPENKDKITKVDHYILIKLINNISKDSAVSFNDKLTLKFHYLPFIIKSKESNIREIEIFFEQRPDCFVDYFKTDFYNLENIDDAKKDEVIQDYFFKNEVMSAFKHIPGQIENTDKIDSLSLEKWIDTVQKYAKNQGINIDRDLGKLLIYGPREENVLFPSSDVCNIFEKICNQDIQKSLFFEIINGAGSPTITAVDGGESYTAIKQAYENISKKYSKRDYPHTNSLLKMIIDDYDAMARQQKEEVHLRQMGVEVF